MTETDDRDRAERVERSLATKLSWGLPGATILLAIGVLLGLGVGPAILVLAAGCFVGVIAVLWASLRTLGGDAPLAEGLATAAAMRSGVSPAAERKRRVFRALKDLELEHTIGKIDDADYAEISARYREQAKGILREMDVEIDALRPDAEALVRKHLRKRGVGAGASPEAAAAAAPVSQNAERAEKSPASGAADGRIECPACATRNEPDAAFCKKCRASLQRIVCPKCSVSNEPDATFCKKCGTGLGKSTADAPRVAEAKDA